MRNFLINTKNIIYATSFFALLVSSSAKMTNNNDNIMNEIDLCYSRGGTELHTTLKAVAKEYAYMMVHAVGGIFSLAYCSKYLNLVFKN